MMKRLEKIMTPEKAAGLVKDGDTVVVGGFTIQNKPMVMIRSLIKQRVKDLVLVGAGPAGIDVDMLIGAGCVKKLVSAAVNAERLGSIGPRYRKYAEEGRLHIWECSQNMVIAGLRASTMGLPFMPTKSGLGTDFLRVNPDLKLFQDPIKGETLVAVPAIKPDVAIIITKRADAYGNSQHGGLVVFDQLAATAADKVIVVADEIVAPEVIRADAIRTTVNCFNVIGVVEAPYGAHPCANHGCYPVDEDGVLEYLAAARNDDAFKSYLEKYVYGVTNHIAYLQLVGIERLIRLASYKTPNA